MADNHQISMISNALQTIGAILATILGLNSRFLLSKMSNVVGHEYNNPVNLVEIRVLFGSFFVALPAYALKQLQSELFTYYVVNKNKLKALVLSRLLPKCLVFESLNKSSTP